jgi:guanine nucleotide-binding protein subunit alpha
MRVIHSVAFNAHEIEFYRQLVFQNLTYGLKCILDASDELQLVTAPENADAVKLVEEAPDLKDGDAFPPEYEHALARLWKDANIAQTVARGNEFALPEKYGLAVFLVWENPG